MATASNNLVQTIEQDFLACAICFEQLTDPIGLPCLHGFCFECLENWHKTSLDKAIVICPACKETARVPTGGIRGFPGHFLIKNLRETIDMEKQVCICGTYSRPSLLVKLGVDFERDGFRAGALEHTRFIFEATVAYPFLFAKTGCLCVGTQAPLLF